MVTDGHSSEADPTSNAWPIFQGRTCLPVDNPRGNCTLGGFPAYAVNITSVYQIQLAINFARRSNLRLVIKNTGHDFLGKSLGAGSLSIWTHHLNDISFLPDYHGPGYQGAAMKVGAGVRLDEVYAAADRNDATVAGGVCQVSPTTNAARS